MSQGPHFILGHILDNLSAGYMTCTGEPEVWYSNPVVRQQWEQNVQQKRVFGTYRYADNSYRVSEDVDASSFKRQLFEELEASASFPPEDNYPSVTILVGDQITSQAINAASGGVLVLRDALVHIPYDVVFSGLLIVESSNVEIGGGDGPHLTGKMLLTAGEHAFDDVVRIAIYTGEVTPQAPFELEPRTCADIVLFFIDVGVKASAGMAGWSGGGWAAGTLPSGHSIWFMSGYNFSVAHSEAYLEDDVLPLGSKINNIDAIEPIGGGPSGDGWLPDSYFYNNEQPGGSVNLSVTQAYTGKVTVGESGTTPILNPTVVEHAYTFSGEYGRGMYASGYENIEPLKIEIATTEESLDVSTSYMVSSPGIYVLSDDEWYHSAAPESGNYQEGLAFTVTIEELPDLYYAGRVLRPIAILDHAIREVEAEYTSQAGIHYPGRVVLAVRYG